MIRGAVLLTPLFHLESNRMLVEETLCTRGGEQVCSVYLKSGK